MYKSHFLTLLLVLNFSSLWAGNQSEKRTCNLLKQWNNSLKSHSLSSLLVSPLSSLRAGIYSEKRTCTWLEQLNISLKYHSLISLLVLSCLWHWARSSFDKTSVCFEFWSISPKCHSLSSHLVLTCLWHRAMSSSDKTSTCFEFWSISPDSNSLGLWSQRVFFRHSPSLARSIGQQMTSSHSHSVSAFNSPVCSIILVIIPSPKHGDCHCGLVALQDSSLFALPLLMTI